jgi:hypothetical protein
MKTNCFKPTGLIMKRSPSISGIFLVTTARFLSGKLTAPPPAAVKNSKPCFYSTKTNN